MRGTCGRRGAAGSASAQTATWDGHLHRTNVCTEGTPARDRPLWGQTPAARRSLWGAGQQCRAGTWGPTCSSSRPRPPPQPLAGAGACALGEVGTLTDTRNPEAEVSAAAPASRRRSRLARPLHPVPPGIPPGCPPGISACPLPSPSSPSASTRLRSRPLPQPPQPSISAPLPHCPFCTPDPHSLRPPPPHAPAPSIPLTEEVTVLMYQARWRPWGSRQEQSNFSSCLGKGREAEGEAEGEDILAGSRFKGFSAKKLSDQDKSHLGQYFKTSKSMQKLHHAQNIKHVNKGGIPAP